VLRTRHVGGSGCYVIASDPAGIESGPNAKTPAARIRGRHERSRSTATATSIDISTLRSDDEPAGLPEHTTGLVKTIGSHIRATPNAELLGGDREDFEHDRDGNRNDQIAAPTQQPSNAHSKNLSLALRGS